MRTDTVHEQNTRAFNSILDLLGLHDSDCSSSKAENILSEKSVDQFFPQADTTVFMDTNTTRSHTPPPFPLLPIGPLKPTEVKNTQTMINEFYPLPFSKFVSNDGDLVASLQIPLPPRTHWYLPINIGEIPANALLDNGSTYSLAHSDLCDLSQLDRSAATPQLRTASGIPVSIKGVYKTKIRVGKFDLEHTFYVCSELAHPVILGLTFYYQVKAVANYKNDTLQIEINNTQQIFEFRNKHDHYLVTPISLTEELSMEPEVTFTGDRKLISKRSVLIRPHRFASIPFEITPLPLTGASIFTIAPHIAEQLCAKNVGAKEVGG